MNNCSIRYTANSKLKRETYDEMLNCAQPSVDLM